jgi:hypothetical protein
LKQEKPIGSIVSETARGDGFIPQMITACSNLGDQMVECSKEGTVVVGEEMRHEAVVEELVIEVVEEVVEKINDAEEMKKNVMDDGNESDNTIQYDEAQLCRSTHNWEECDMGGYVTIGVLKRRRCHCCGSKFMAGKKGKDEDPGGKFWVSRRNIVFHCVDCKVCACLGKFDICSPSPRKLKVPNRIRDD